MRLWRFLIMLPAFLLVSQGAWCAGLGAKQVEGFIGAMQELKPYFDQYADEAEDDGDATSTSRLMGDWARSLKDQREVEGMLKKHGFTVESWGEVSQQVTQAYMAVKLGKDGEDVLGQMQQSLDEISSNKDIPAEYKAQMVEQMKQSMAEMEKTLATSPENQEAVRPFLPQLDTIFEWQE